MSPDLDRRDFLKATATAGTAALAGCQTNTDEDEDTTTEETTDTSTPEPSYSIQASPLQYDLTTLATSEADQHDQAYVQDNYSAELGVTVLENGEEADLEELGEVHLEDEEGERLETTEEGYVPEYAVEDGQELTVKAEVDGETKEDTVTVNKELPGEFYADARISEDGETLYDTDWTTPYSFDNHIVDRQAFLDQREERREEHADDQLITDSDLSILEEAIEKKRDEWSRTEIIGGYLGGLGLAMEGGGPYEGSGADNNAVNVEQAMREHTDYRPIYIGGFTNPQEPDVPSAGDGDGFPVRSKLAFIERDWYQNDPSGSTHIEDIEETPMVRDNPSQLAVSVLGEFERGDTDIENPGEAEEYIEAAVTSPVTLNGNMTELELSDDISWEILNSIRENTDWTETMAPLELATAIGSEIDGKVEVEGETPGSSRIKLR